MYKYILHESYGTSCIIRSNIIYMLLLAYRNNIRVDKMYVCEAMTSIYSYRVIHAHTAIQSHICKPRGS